MHTTFASSRSRWLFGLMCASALGVVTTVNAVPPTTQPSAAEPPRKDWFLQQIEKSHAINLARHEQERREALEQRRAKHRLAKLLGAGGTALSFNADGSKLLTAGGKEVCLWDVRTFQPLLKPLKRDDEVRAASFSPDGKLVLTAAGKDARLWDAGTGQLVQTLQHEGTVLDAAFSPDGRQIVTGWGERKGDRVRGAAELWDAATGKSVRWLKTWRDPAQAVGFSPDGDTIYAVGGDAEDPAGRFLRVAPSLYLWNAVTGESRNWGNISGDPASIQGRPAFSADGKSLAFCTNYADPVSVVGIQNLRSLAYPGASHPEVRPSFEIVQFRRIVMGHERLLIAGSCVGRGDPSAQVWDIGPETEEIPASEEGPAKMTIFKTRQVRGLAEGQYVTSGVLSADGKRVAVAGTRFDPDQPPQKKGYEEWAGVWDIATGTPLLDDAADGVGKALIALSPDGKLVAVGYSQSLVGDGGHTSLWRVPDRPANQP